LKTCRHDLLSACAGFSHTEEGTQAKTLFGFSFVDLTESVREKRLRAPGCAGCGGRRLGQNSGLAPPRLHRGTQK
jgi:hypothetical protein